MIPRTPTVVAALTLAAALALTACGREPAADTPPATAEGISAGPATGTITMWAQGTEAEALPEMLKAFEAENPGVDVQVTPVPWDEAQNKYQTAVAGGTTPDVGMLGTDWMPSFRDALQPAPTEIDVSGMFPESVASTEFGGARYGVPWYAETRVIFYRTDLMRQAGFDTFPTTWGGLKELAKAMQQRAGATYGINLPAGGWNTYIGVAPFFWSGGAEIADPGATRWTFDTPEMRTGVEYVNSFFAEGIANANPDAAAGEAAAAFVSGTIPMMMSGPWDVGQVMEAAGPGFEDKFAVAPMPVQVTGTSLIAGANLVVFEQAKNRDAAWKLIRWLARPETQIEFFRATGDLPSHREAWNDPLLAGDPKVSVFGQQLQHVKTVPPVDTWPEVAAAADTALEQVFRGGKDPATALRELQATADSIGMGRR